MKIKKTCPDENPCPKNDRRVKDDCPKGKRRNKSKATMVSGTTKSGGVIHRMYRRGEGGAGV